MSTELGKIHDALQRHDAGAALAAALEAWRAIRSPVLADLVERLSERGAADRPPLASGLPRERDVEWLGRAAAGDPSDLPHLLPGLAAGNSKLALRRLGTLADWPGDPRLGAALIFWIVDRVFDSPSTQPFRDELFRQLPRHLDTRLRNRLDEPHMMGFEPERTIRTRDIIDERWQTGPGPREMTAEESTLCIALGERVDELPESAGARQRRYADDFVREIGENPEDDDLRQVFADWLLEKGDPWGEFINLQYQKLAGTLTEKQKKRERSLLYRHRRIWLGPLARAVKVSSVVFERGFPVICESATSASWKDVNSSVGDPRWATIREIRGTTYEWERAIRDPGMRSLRTVIGISPRFALALFADPQVRLFEELVIWPQEFHAPLDWADVRRIGDCSCLPRLRSLTFENGPKTYWRRPPSPKIFRDFWTSALGQRLERFGTVVRWQDMGLWLRTLLENGDGFRGVLILWSPGVEVRWDVDDAGRRSRLFVELREEDGPSETPSPGELARLVESLPDDTLTHLEVTGNVGDTPPLAEAVERQKRLVTLILPGTKESSG